VLGIETVVVHPDEGRDVVYLSLCHRNCMVVVRGTKLLERLMVHMRLKTSRGDMGKVGRVLFPRCRSSSSKRGDDYGESIAVHPDIGLC